MLLEVEADDASSRCQGAYHNVDGVDLMTSFPPFSFLPVAFVRVSKKHSVASGWFDCNVHGSAISLGT
jgi:hypothetical protein